MRAKMPESTWEFWVWFIVIALLCVGVCRLWRGLYWLAVPGALFMLYQGWSFLISNVSFREAMIRELGFGYFVQYASAFTLPVIAIALYAFYDFKFRRRPAA